MSKYPSDLGFDQLDFVIMRNSGVCEGDLTQFFGLGSETRKTAIYVPDPYGIEVGNPVEVPPGYEERWLLNAHAIETRGAEDRLGCTECRCDLCNVTKDEYNWDIEPNYIGGMRCCHDEVRCRTGEGFQGPKKSLYLKYTVKYVHWHAFIMPVKIYILDVTDIWRRWEPTGLVSRHHCQDGQVICSSLPIYGKGKEPGNEAGYIVGMSTCYPRPGSVKISEGESLTLLSNYSSDQRQTGVMGLFYLLVAEPSPKPSSILQSRDHIGDIVILPNAWAVAGFGIAALVAAVVTYRRQSERGGV